MTSGTSAKRAAAKNSTPAKTRRSASKAIKSESPLPATPIRKTTGFTSRVPSSEDIRSNGRVNGRSLIVWNRPRMTEKLLLHLHYECIRHKIQLPWDAAAHRLRPGSSGAAIQQHIGRLRRELVAEGHLVPPLPVRPSSKETGHDPEIRGYVRDMDGDDRAATRPVRFDEVCEDLKMSLPDSFIKDEEAQVGEPKDPILETPSRDLPFEQHFPQSLASSPTPLGPAFAYAHSYPEPNGQFLPNQAHVLEPRLAHGSSFNTDSTSASSFSDNSDNHLMADVNMFTGPGAAIPDGRLSVSMRAIENRPADQPRAQMASERTLTTSSHGPSQTSAMSSAAPSFQAQDPHDPFSGPLRRLVYQGPPDFRRCPYLNHPGEQHFPDMSPAYQYQEGLMMQAAAMRRYQEEHFLAAMQGGHGLQGRDTDVQENRWEAGERGNPVAKEEAATRTRTLSPEGTHPCIDQSMDEFVKAECTDDEGNWTPEDQSAPEQLNN